MVFILRQASSTASGPPSPKWKARAVRIAASCFAVVGDGALDVPLSGSLIYLTIVGDGALDVPLSGSLIYFTIVGDGAIAELLKMLAFLRIRRPAEWGLYLSVDKFYTLVSTKIALRQVLLAV